MILENFLKVARMANFITTLQENLHKDIPHKHVLCPFSFEKKKKKKKLRLTEKRIGKGKGKKNMIITPSRHNLPSTTLRSVKGGVW